MSEVHPGAEMVAVVERRVDEAYRAQSWVPGVGKFRVDGVEVQHRERPEGDHIGEGAGDEEQSRVEGQKDEQGRVGKVTYIIIFKNKSYWRRRGDLHGVAYSCDDGL